MCRIVGLRYWPAHIRTCINPYMLAHTSSRSEVDTRWLDCFWWLGERDTAHPSLMPILIGNSSWRVSLPMCTCLCTSPWSLCLVISLSSAHRSVTRHRRTDPLPRIGSVLASFRIARASADDKVFVSVTKHRGCNEMTARTSMRRFPHERIVCYQVFLNPEQFRIANPLSPH